MQAIYDNVVEIDEEISKTTVENMYKKILGCIPGEWVILINKEVAKRSRGFTGFIL